MKSAISILLLSLIAMASPALSESGVPSFALLDANQDGLISRDEARADERVAASFADADQDRDGYLSPEEFSAKWQ
ncbi:MAG: EF-hand domain-containing protein [Woeseiaceae bacterium]|nr:EF-hand domain-containing protein [Woeseiaceae bacterium]